MVKKENLLDFIAYHKKWHSNAQRNRETYFYNTNDFLIEEIFKRLEIEKGTYVEFGAWDGIHLSNTRRLFEKNWKGLLIEADKKKFADLQKNYENTDVRTVNAFLNTTDCLIDDVVENNIDENIDFCSIDIDGLDLEIFETFQKNMPKVVCIEGGQVVHPLEKPLPRNIAALNVQQSLKTMTDVFESKGYRLLCSYQDSFFIKKEFYHLFDVEENLIIQYIDGLICLPRIPYILKLLERINMQNNILEKALKDVSQSITKFVVHQGKSEHKMAWVDQYYETINKNLTELKEQISV
jgi:hypothetical protein